MKLCGLFPLFTILLFGIHSTQAVIKPKHDKVVTCYVASWAYYRKDAGKFGPTDLRPELCTHVVYAFAGLNATSWTIKSLDPWGDIEEGGIGNYRRMTDLRKKNPDIRVSLAIGGWGEGSKNYSELASSPDRRKTFINSVVNYLRKYEFDGFDLDWEFPGERGGAVYDKNNFALLVQELREAFTGRSYLLTAAISANKRIIENAYDISTLSKYLDYIHVMAYDYHGTWDSKVLPNAPLKDANGMSVADSIQYLLKIGAPANKLVLGVPMYGRTFILATTPERDNPTAQEESSIGQPSLSSGFKGPYTNEEGFMGYNEICQEIVKDPKGWRKGWHDESSTPYAVNGDHVIVYDDPRSMTEKVKFAIKSNLAGIMVWSIDTDDTRGKCASLNVDFLDPLTGIDYPLMRTINLVLASYKDTRIEDNNLAPSSTKNHSYSCLLILLALSVSYSSLMTFI